jgi:4-amino-4-deoxy-L-arabinose transferase-like glycosyltransferase
MRKADPVNTPFSKSRSLAGNCRKLLVPFLLGLVLLAGAFLRFYHLGVNGVGNAYYAATVKSMLVSWHNFFFAAFEPGGSISVDKPPLGFWVEALSAYFLGVNGLALALPNAVAGVFSIFVLYKILRRPFGSWAGLAAALVLAVMPVAISTERNNTIDGMLVCVLLLAAWAFLQSVYTGKLRLLFLGTVLVGLGFNIKMLQAFMPLPAFYAVYFLGVKRKWWKKLLELAAATLVLLVVSFSWAVAVDLTPAAERPYVDSSSNNSVMELIFGHNGIERLTNLGQRMGLDGRQAGLFGPGGSSGNQPPAGLPGNGNPQPFSEQNLPPAGPSNGNPPQPPSVTGFPPGSGNSRGSYGPQQGSGQVGGPAGSMDFGRAGALRLFTEPLVGEASWLLPFALGGLVTLLVALWNHIFDEKHVSVILWAGWLILEVIYFTLSTGLMHSYYLIMLGAPISALAAMTAWSLWRLIQKHALAGWSSLFLLVIGTLVFQGITLWGTTGGAVWVVGAAGIMFGLGLLCFAFSMVKVRWAAWAFGIFMGSILIAPAAWSILTSINSSPNGALPAAGPALQDQLGGRPMDQMEPRMNGMGENGNQGLMNYLLANTQPGTYLLATGNASEAASYILATGRPVLTFGGFLGQYDEVSVNQLSSLVGMGQLRFVLGEGSDQHPEIAQWIKQYCKVVNEPKLNKLGGLVLAKSGGPQSFTVLYDCEK